MDNIRNFCIIAHIDHGKSTLADRFLEITETVPKGKLREQYLDSMSLEKERGITIKMHPVRMIYHPKIKNAKCKTQNENNSEFLIHNSKLSNSEYILNLIDTPGHVDFSYEVSRSLNACEGAILLCDATQGIQAQTLANYFLAKEEGLAVIPVINKIDLPNAQPEKFGRELAELVGVKEEEVIFISAKSGINVDRVLEAIVEKIPAPTGDINKPLRALVFDSLFDQHKGVIAFVRIFDGKIKKGDELKLLSTKKESIVLEVGIFKPDFSPVESLGVGETGYIITGFKEVKDCRVGDTVTKVSSSDVEPLKGYKEPQPMVFASFYCTDADDYSKFKEALGKLSLNDAAFTFKSEGFSELGFGFRCGFLGMLHLEIIKERLEREYDLDLIVTAPSVSYQVILNGNREKFVHSPQEFPDAGEIVAIQEPWVRIEVFSPVQYLGPIMELVKKFRGIYKKTEYLAEDVILFYEMPLASFLDNFFNGLKNISAGYASMNYHFLDYRPGDLVKMDIKIAGKKVDALSFIIPNAEIQIEGKRLVAELKKVIPRQLFEITIQATVGAQIISRETVSAARKNVTAKLYGGDRTRKDKLLKKQKAGKAKLKRIGTVDVPQEAFFAILKNR
ncbi:elongation factor 4 [Candidatus Jorgensenbacteria bacterium RIFCSPLOWO2_12_FULL_42_11]|uniref:Elongation factor 4 n=1 Tax=Candidatus Jorgensenbacteria bacterium RIFCSPLOWO2_12_FULL_42_11 TaxID=1798473 RepID=A0A1F6C1B5_9BACT|nr:MAG: elongation factor 4 [Candidatus Jorgensenbacteria bacterium RIFCSPLOWO2_12_FULL_42_11]